MIFFFEEMKKFVEKLSGDSHPESFWICSKNILTKSKFETLVCFSDEARVLWEIRNTMGWNDFISKKWKSWVSTFVQKLSGDSHPESSWICSKKIYEKQVWDPCLFFRWGKSTWIQWDEIYCEVAFLIYVHHYFHDIHLLSHS